MEKKKLLVSFSGGETSAFMAQWLWNNKREEYDMIFVFANTGQENEETLLFVDKCSKYFGFPVVWIETKMNPEHGKGASFTITDYNNADRKGKVFEDVIKKHGIPNQSTPHCSRELKAYPIKAYAKSIGWKHYYTAIGIRADEVDRINAQREKLRLYYPLISDRAMTKPKINLWWSKKPFRLNLKGYEGNCKWCWKKGETKLWFMIKNNPEYFEFPKRMEDEYGEFVPKSRIESMKKHGKEPNLPVRFFRKNRSVEDLVREAEHFNINIPDDASSFDIQLDLFDLLSGDFESIEKSIKSHEKYFESLDLDGESCDIYSECGLK